MNETFYKNVLYNSPIGYAYHEIILDKNGVPCDYKFIEVNPAFELFTGLFAKDIIGKTVLEVIPSIVEDEFDWISFYGDIAIHNKKKEFESFSGPLNNWYNVEVFSPKTNFFITIFSNITEVKEQKEQLTELSSIFSTVIKNAPVPVMIHNDEGQVLNISETWKNISGYSHDDIPTIEEWTKRAYGIKQANVNNFIKKLYYLKKPQHDGEFPINTKDDRTVLWDFYSTYIGNTPDNHRMAMSVAIDVTEERKHKEELIKERLLFQTTLLSVGDGVICTNESGKITLINSVAEELTGWKKEDAIGAKIEDVFSIHNEITGKVSEDIIEKVLNTGIIHELANHTILRAKDGVERPIADSAAPIVLSDGTIIGAVLVFRDYTEKYNTQKELDSLLSQLQHTQLLLQASLNSPLDIIILSLDKEFKYLFFNEAHRKSMQVAYNTDVEIGKCLFDYMTSEDDIKRAKFNYEKALSGITHTTLQQFGDFDVHSFETIYNPIRDTENNIIGVSAFARDVSERVKAENQIKESEENLKLILDSTSEGMYGVDLENNCTFVNRSFLRILGYQTESEFLGKNMHNLIHHHHEDGTPYLEKDCGVEMVALSGKKVDLGETVLWKKDNTPIYVEYSSNPQFKNDELIGAIVTFRDVTDKRKARRDLQNEKELAQEYLNIAEVMIVVLNKYGEVTLINKKGCSIIGLSEQEIVGKNWFDNFVPKEIVKAVKKVFKNVFKDTSGDEPKLPTHYENSIINSHGEERYISWYNSILYDSEKHIIGVLSSGEDITEMNIANEKLMASEKRFRRLFEQAPFGYQSLDESGHFIEVNQKWLEIFGYEKEEVIGKWFGDFLVPEMKAHFEKRFKQFKRDGSIHSEFSMKTKDGQIILVGFDGNIAYDANQVFTQTHCTVSDITEINIANEKLKESELRYRELISNLDAGIVVHAPDTSITSFNKRAEEILGLAYHELNGITASSSNFNFINSTNEKLKYAEYPINIILKNKTALKNYTIGVKHIHEDKLVWVSVNGVPLLNADGTIKEIVISFTDISLEKTKQDEITYLSNHDFLTGLYNRRYFVEIYKEKDNPSYYPLGIMMLDVNGLKIINDAFGHDVGDVALKKVSKILTKSCRKQDIACRIGGDEFAVILPKVTLEDLELIRDKIKERSKKEHVENVTLSLATGYEIKTADSKGSLDEILKQAENHMYRHKLTEGISIRNNAIKAILKTLTDKYAEERIHSAKVSQLCKKIGQELELKEDDLKELELAGMYHDIGKISIPDAVLNKPGKLTKEEFDTIKTHPEISYQILRAADEYSDLAIHALYHHERWDGKGYPSGKKGEEIPLFSRIICIVDAYEAMTAVRVYKEKMSEEDAVKEIIRCSGTQFDKRIAKIFVEKVLQKEW